MAAVWAAAALLEAPYCFTPTLQPAAQRSLAVIGDSVTAGIGDEALQIVLNRRADLRHQIVEDQPLGVGLDVLEGREGADDADGDGHQRHQSQQRGIGQRRRRLRAAVLGKPPRRVAQEPARFGGGLARLGERLR